MYLPFHQDYYSASALSQNQVVLPEDEWGIIDVPSKVSTVPAMTKKQKTPFFGSVMMNAKSRLYNFYRPLRKTNPDFTDSPIVLLGVVYRSSEHIELDGRNDDGELSYGRRHLGDFDDDGDGRPFVVESPDACFHHTSDDYSSSTPSFVDTLAAGLGWSIKKKPPPSPRGGGGGGGGGKRPLLDAEKCKHIHSFLDDWNSRIWITYRSGFPPIHDTHFTSDLGWGCMLRTGQMMLAQALITHHIGRDWRLGHHMGTYHRILSQFADTPDPSSPYSIHAIAHMGSQMEKPIGSWFDPTTISRVLKVLLRKHGPSNLTLYVPKDSIMYTQSVSALCTMSYSSDMSITNDDEGDTPSPWKSVIILLPTRLGAENLNPMYIPVLKSYLEFPQSLGIIGGKPQSSFYFMGYQDDTMFYLDPHFVREAIPREPGSDDDAEDAERVVDESYHTMVPQSMPMELIDPSMVICFYCRDRSDYEDLCRRINRLTNEDALLPVVSIEEMHPEMARATQRVGSSEEERSRMSYSHLEEDVVLL